MNGSAGETQTLAVDFPVDGSLTVHVPERSSQGNPVLEIQVDETKVLEESLPLDTEAAWSYWKSFAMPIEAGDHRIRVGNAGSGTFWAAYELGNYRLREGPDLQIQGLQTDDYLLLWARNPQFIWLCAREGRKAQPQPPGRLTLKGARDGRYSVTWRYTYSAKLNRGFSVATEHGPGCWTTTGCDPDGFASSPSLWIDMVHRDDQQRVLEFIQSVLAGEPFSPIVHRIIHRDGSVRRIRNTIVPHYEDGALVGHDGVVEEITEREAAEAALHARGATLLAAQRIQAQLLPDAPRALHGYDVAGASLPADFTGGDYFDCLSLLDDSMAFALGDVSGPSLGPALAMARIHAHLRSPAKMHSDLSEIVSRTNQLLIDEEEEGGFVTLFLGMLAPLTKWFPYVNAEHPPAYVLDRKGRIRGRLESASLPVGILADAKFPIREPIRLERGDLVLLLTDGILEAASPTVELFGIDRAIRLVREHRELNSRNIIDRFYDEVRRFSGSAKLRDDMTSIVITVQSIAIGSLPAAEEILLERAAVDMARKRLACILVLHPEAAARKPDAVVAAVGANDGRQGAGSPLAACQDAPRPAFVHGSEQIGAAAVGIGENDIATAVGVDVDEPEAGIATVSIDDRRAGGQSKREPLPTLRLGVPTKGPVFAGVRNHDLTQPVAVQIAEPHAAVAATGAGSHGVFQAKPFQPSRLFYPLGTVKVPQSGSLFIADEQAGVAIRAEYAEANARVPAVASGIDGDQLHRKVENLPCVGFR